jgi:peptidylprolyl isomerase
MTRVTAKAAICLTIITTAAMAASPPAVDPASWRTVDAENLVLIDTHYGQVAVEIAPPFAPRHVERLRALIRAGFYDGKSFYRVVDGFVAQGGAGEGKDVATASHLKAWPMLKAEFDAPLDGPFTPLGSPDLFAAEVGHIDGFPVARDPKDARQWLIHCPGTFAFARDNNPDTASTEFYIVIGQAPRRLDRDLTAFGRVIAGMQYLQKLERGDPDVDIGVIQDPAKRDPIVRMRIAADLPVKERPVFSVMRTDSPAFADLKEQRLHPTSPFYFRKPPPVLDICSVPVPVKLLTP